MEQLESPSQRSHLLINPPSILFPQILKLSVDVGGMVSIVGITEEKNLQVHHHLQTEISHAEYEEDLPELATGVVVPKLNENELEDPMSLAQTVALSLINIMENNQYLLGILHFECNGFESVIDFNENRQIEIDPMPLCEAFLKGRLEGATPDLLNNPPPPNISVFFHHENLNSIFKFAWKQRSDLFVLLERIAGSAYGIGTFEKSEDEWALHLYVLEDDLSETGQRGMPQPYPETWNELKEKIVAGTAFPIVWFRIDVGYPFAFSLLEEWDNAKQLSLLVNAKERYDEYAVESMKDMTMPGEGEEGEDLPGSDKKLQKRFKAFTEGKLDPKKDMQMALDDMKGAMEDLEKLIPSDWNLVEDKVVTISETDPDLWYSKAFAARAENNLEDAKSAVEKAIGYERDRIREDLGIPEGEPFPENLPQQEKLAKYLHEYGIIFLLNKEPNEALVAFKNARNFDPANAEILKNLAKAYASLDRPLEASGIYAEIVKISPDDSEVWLDLGEMHFKAKEFKVARESFQKAVNIAPEDSSLLARLGFTNLELQDWEQAQTIFAKAAVLNSNELDYILALGIAFDGKTDPIEARSFLLTFPKLRDQSTFEQHYLIGLANLALGRDKHALEQFNDAKAYKEDHYRLWALIADISEKEGNLNGAANALVHMDQLKPNQVPILERLAAIREQFENWDLVVETYTALTHVRPYSGKYFDSLGISLKKAGATPEEIFTAFSQAVEVEKTNALYWNHLASYCVLIGDFDKAIEAAEESLKLEKNNPLARNALACVYFSQGKPTNDLKLIKKAAKDFEALLKEVPPDKWAKMINLPWALQCFEMADNMEKADIVRKALKHSEAQDEG